VVTGFVGDGDEALRRSVILRCYRHRTAVALGASTNEMLIRVRCDT
jgi:hypothetical protein